MSRRHPLSPGFSGCHPLKASGKAHGCSLDRTRLGAERLPGCGSEAFVLDASPGTRGNLPTLVTGSRTILQAR